MTSGSSRRSDTTECPDTCSDWSATICCRGTWSAVFHRDRYWDRSVTIVCLGALSHLELLCDSILRLTLVIGRIRVLGLKVAINKLEALCIHGCRGQPPDQSHLLMDGVRYFGIVLSRPLSSTSPLINGRSERTCVHAAQLRGINVACRRLYMGCMANQKQG